jgi:hypothetical protein
MENLEYRACYITEEHISLMEVSDQSRKKGILLREIRRHETVRLPGNAVKPDD